MSSTEVALAILSVIGFMGALPQIWGSNWKDIWLYYQNGVLSWNTVHKAYINLVAKLKTEGFVPTAIIGIGRGGVVAAGLIGSELLTERLTADMEHRESIQKPIKIGTINSVVSLKGSELRHGELANRLVSRVDKIELTEPEIELRNDDKVLLVVAQHFTGASLNKAMNILLSKGIRREYIKTATVFWHRHRNVPLEHEPDLFGLIAGVDKTVPWKDSRISTDRY